MSDFDEESLSLLNKKSKVYFDTFFPKNDIYKKYKDFYMSKSDIIEVQKKEFIANIPISTLSIIDKCC